MYSPVLRHAGSNTMPKGKKVSKNTATKSKKQKQMKQRTVYVERPLPSLGAQIGDKLQKLGESLFTRFMGSGDYTCNQGSYDVKSNALIKGGQARAVKMGSNGTNFVFEHSEYIGDVVTSSTTGAFNQTVYNVNPFNSVTFPWLSNLAPNFETYEIEGMIFRFVSTSGESVASTTTSIGSVMGTFVYDTLDPNFVSKQQLLQYDDTVDCRFSESFICGLECDKTRIPTFSSKLYVGNVPTGADAKFYNFGNFVIATQGSQAASVNIGELWVSYRIRFHVTKDTNFVSGSYKITSSTTGMLNPFQTVSASAGTLITTINTSQVIIKNAQVGAYYAVTQLAESTAGSVNYSTVSPTLVGASFVNLLNGDGSGIIYSSLSSTIYCSVTFTVVATAATWSFSSPWLGPASANKVDTIINQLDASIVA
jgi:hypothetical protein